MNMFVAGIQIVIIFSVYFIIYYLFSFLSDITSFYQYNLNQLIKMKVLENNAGESHYIYFSFSN